MKGNFCEEFDFLNEGKKQYFKSCVAKLLNQTYLNHLKTDGVSFNEDYLFVVENFSLFQAYFTFGGYELTHHQEINVLSLQNSFSFAKRNFDKENTLYLLGLRLLFDEKIKESIGSSAVTVRISEWIDKLIDYGIKDRKPNFQSMSKILRNFASLGIIGKNKGKWEDLETLFIIYPAILLLLPLENLESALASIEQEEKANDSTQTAIDDSLAIL